MNLMIRCNVLDCLARVLFVWVLLHSVRAAAVDVFSEQVDLLEIEYGLANAGSVEISRRAKDVFALMERKDLWALEKVFADTSHPYERKLAAAVLVLMDDSKVDAGFVKLATNGKNENVRRESLWAIGLMPQERARNAVQKVLSHDGINGEDVQLKRRCMGLLAAVGDEASLLVLEGYSKSGNEQIQQSAHIARQSLIKCLSCSAGLREGWQSQELTYWRAVAFMQNFVAKRGGYRNAAEGLKARGVRFDKEFLLFKLSINEPLAIAIVGQQQEKWAVDYLRVEASDPGFVGGLTRDALARIGTEEACRILAHVSPPASSN